MAKVIVTLEETMVSTHLLDIPDDYEPVEYVRMLYKSCSPKLDTSMAESQRVQVSFMNDDDTETEWEVL